MPRRLELIVVCLALCFAQTGCHSDPTRLEAFATRWRALFNAHDVAGLTKLYADHGAFSTPGMVYFVRSPTEMQGVLKGLWDAAPDMRISAVHYLVAANDQIAFVWEITRTPPMGTAPSKAFGATFMTVKDGVIQEQLNVTAR